MPSSLRRETANLKCVVGMTQPARTECHHADDPEEATREHRLPLLALKYGSLPVDKEVERRAHPLRQKADGHLLTCEKVMSRRSRPDPEHTSPRTI